MNLVNHFHPKNQFPIFYTQLAACGEKSRKLLDVINDVEQY